MTIQERKVASHIVSPFSGKLHYCQMDISKKILASFVAIAFLVPLASCGTPTAEELAARPTEDDASKWDDEDYKTIAAKGCLKYKDAFQKSIGDLYGDWDSQIVEYMGVKLTTGALKGHAKYDPLAQTVNSLYMNALERSLGSSYPIDDTIALKANDICLELGVDITE